MTGPGDRPRTRSSSEAMLPERRTRERCSGGRHTTTTTTITTATAETRERCVPRYTSAAMAVAEAVSRPGDFLRSIIIIVIITRSVVCEITSYHPTTQPYMYTHMYMYVLLFAYYNK